MECEWKNWDKIPIGQQSGSVEITVTDEMIDEYVEAMELRHPLFAKKPSGRRMAPPHMVPHVILFPLYINFLNAHFGNGVFAKQAFQFFEPIWVGTHLKATGELVDKYERRGKHYVTFFGRFSNSEGTPLLTERRTIMVVAPGFKIRDAEEAEHAIVPGH